jgi:hypothetical protein
LALQTKLTVIPAITTIDLIKLSPELDGSNGDNRAIGNRPRLLSTLTPMPLKYGSLVILIQ